MRDRDREGKAGDKKRHANMKPERQIQTDTQSWIETEEKRFRGRQ